MSYSKNLTMKMAKIKKLITHDGPFHTDDIFAAATLSILFERQGETFEIIRTRDPQIIKAGDYVFDVGGIYDAELNRFDHHQIGGAGKRENSIEYSSFGLVWKKFGLEVSQSEDVYNILDEHLVSAIDADDNGFNLFEKKYETSPFLIQDFFKLLRPTWRESSLDYDKNFLEAVNIAKIVLARSIAHGKDKVLARQLLAKAYEEAENKKIIVLDNYYPFGEVFDKLPEPLFVIFPKEDKSNWVVKAVDKEGVDFKNRKDLPKSWSGLTDQALVKVTGVSDAIFCHRGLFIAVAKSKEGAIKLAQIAIESKE